MIFNRRDVYNLLEQCFYVRSGWNGLECGHTLMYRPHAGTIRRVSSEQQEQIQLHQREMLSGFGLNWCQPSVAWQGTIPSGYPRVFFEGFAINPEKELPERLSQHTVPLIGLNPADVWSYWSHKPTFLARCADLFGEGSTPRCFHWETVPSLEEVLAKQQEFFGDGASKVVLKGSGAGAFGNKIVVPSTPDSEIEEFLVNKFDPDSSWLSIEEWVEWKTSPCTSFFCIDGKAIELEMCEQVLTQKGGFIGGKSYSTVLTQDDKASLYQILQLCAQQLVNDGITGVIGIDTIIGNFQSPITLPSGLGVKFIEVNPRVNGHNQERLFIRAIANRDNQDTETIDHVRISLNRRGLPSSSRKAVIELFETILGISHFDQDPVSSEPQFYLDCMHPWPSMYDAVLVYGQDKNRIDAILRYLIESKIAKG